MSYKPIAFVPILAEDADESPSYPPGADPWSGTPRIQEPSAGQYAAGDAPNPSWFSSQALNGLGYRYGRALNAILDQATFDVYARTALVDNGLSYPGGAVANINTTASGDPPLLFVGDDGWLYAQCKLTIRRTRLGQGKQNASAADSSDWVAGASCALSNNSGETGGDGAARPPVMAADRNTGLLVAFARGGDMKASTDRGDTWSSTHVVDASLTTALGGSPSYVTAAACWNGLVFCAYAVGSGPHFSSIWVADQDDLTTWEHVATMSANGGTDNVIGRIVASSDTMLLLPRKGTQVSVVQGGLGDWTKTQVQFATHDAAKISWRGAWNEALGMFLIGCVAGDLWNSLDGFSWNHLVSSATNAYLVRDIVAHGRGYAISNSHDEWALDFLSQNSTQGWGKRRLLSPAQGNTGPASAWHLQNVHGRWVAGRSYESDVDTGAFRLEWYESGVSAWDRNEFVGI